MKNRLTKTIIIIAVVVLCAFGVKSLMEKNSETDAKNFTMSYLEAYKDISKKGNFDEVKSYISQDQITQMAEQNTPFETNYTNFSGYEIVEVEKVKDFFIVKVKLFDGMDILKRQDGNNIFEIEIINDSGDLKSKTWYFAQ